MGKIDINQYVDKFFEHKINASRIFNNPKISFFIILNIVLLIGCYNLLNNYTKNAIMTLVSYPILLISLLSISLFIAYNNLPIGILIIVSLFIILYPSNTQDNNENSQKGYINDIKTIEGFSSNKSERVRKRDEKRKNRDDFTKGIPELKNNFKNIYEELEEEYDNDLKEGIKENLKNLLRKEKINNDKKKETFNDTLPSNDNSYEDEYQKRKGMKERFKTITKRKFNPNNETDSNLLITKEIFKDLINRIAYEYEKPEYLKKYIENRLDEVIDINELGKD